MSFVSFTPFDDYFGAGDSPPSQWSALRNVNLLILVGLTGVGKSTTVNALTDAGLSLCVAPNRRKITDVLIISHMQRSDGEPVSDVRDRIARFGYTRRYRERYPGGMAHALSHIWVSAPAAKELVLFDGLRGVNEVEHAADLLPRARFIVLCAPDGVRVRRLLGRHDQFDQIQLSQSSIQANTQSSPIRPKHAHSLTNQFPVASNLQLSPIEETALFTLLEQGSITSEELEAKLAIVSEERRNYDPDKTLAALLAAASERTCVVDTVENDPTQAAAQITDWIHAG
ncbi:MAG: ATPase [Chloroflexota bacterium]